MQISFTWMTEAKVVLEVRRFFCFYVDMEKGNREFDIFPNDFWDILV